MYEALDRKRSTRVALKLLREAEGTALYRFKREFRALADISHHNLVALDELVTDGWHWFFTMELVAGQSLVSYTRPTPASERPDGVPTRRAYGPLDEARVRAVLPQLVDGLQAIHRAGIVHCDVKPSNVLVTAEGRVVVLDFGLVSEGPGVAASHESSAETDSGSLVVLGTPSYMAPEQARVQRVTPAADWYSVGVMLYEMLTAQRPFSGSHADVIDAKELGQFPPPLSLNPDAPKDLADLSMVLLDPDPERRPAGAAILERLGRAPTRSSADAGTVDSPEALVGRDALLKRLDEMVAATVRGDTVVALVAGPSGIGKTALIRGFLQEQRRADPAMLVLAGRCYERESMPYKAVDPIVDALAKHLRRLRDIEVARLLPRDAAILAKLFPVLLSVAEIQRAPLSALDVLDTPTVRQRAASALRELLFGLAIRAPLVLVIDDAQWGDADSGSILQEVLRPPDPPPLLLVAVHRSEHADHGTFLPALGRLADRTINPRVEFVEVGALSYEDARRLAARLTRVDDADPRAVVIARESRGNAFFIHELAQHALTVGGQTSLDAVVLDRVHALSDASRRLLMGVALSAQALPIDVARSAARLDAHDPEPLQALRSGRLVRGSPDELHLEPYHDRIRESVVAQCAPQELKTWHRRLAAAWEDSGLGRPETLVTHFRAAGDDVKTREYAEAAANRAEAALAFDRATEFLDLLVRLETDVPTRRRWLTGLGQALANAGRGHDAAAAYLRALDEAPADDAIELERRAAAELIRAGYIDQATEVLERLFPKVGVRPLRNDAESFVVLLAYRSMLALRGTRFRVRDASTVPPAELRRIDVLRSIGEPLALSSLIQGNALNMQAVWHALRVGEPRRVVLGLTTLIAMTALGGTRTESRAKRLVEQADKLAASLDDPQATGRVALAEGIALKVSGHWKRGVERLERANAIFATLTGARWEIQTAQTLIHDALYWMGEWERLARELPARRQEAEQRGDLYSATHVVARLSPLVHLAGDRIDDARAEAESGLEQWTKRAFHLQHRFAVCTGLDIDLYAGDPAAASRRLTEAWPALRRMLFVFQNARIEMIFYRARVALALVRGGNAATLREATHDMERLEREGAPWAGALARLVRASIAHARGQPDRAATALVSAEAALRGCDMHLYAAAAQYRRAHLVGGAEGETLASQACNQMRAQQIVNPERMADLLAPGVW